VEVEYPRIGEGTLLARAGLREPRKVKGELIDARAAALANLTVPTATAVFTLVDDGTGVDVFAKNGVWSGELSGLGRTDGIYKLHYIFDFTAKGCTTHRELTESMYVEVGVDPKSTKIKVEPRNPTNGWTVNRLAFTPVDRLGNPLGPGRVSALACRPADACHVSGDLVDDGHGGYAIDVAAAANVASVRLDAFGVAFDVPLPCPNCARLSAIAVDPGQVVNQQQSKGIVRLNGKAPSNKAGGAVVYLSSDLSRVASVPDSVLVPAGKTEVTFPVTVYHVHDMPETVTIEASYGGTRARAKITVSPPDPDPDAPKPVPSMKKKEHYHPD
jgi:hypothetical protein